MKIYYKIPDSDNEQQNKLIGMLYENYKLRIELALAPAAKIFDNSQGVIFIERLEDSIELRYEGFAPEAELIAKWLIAQIRDVQKVRY